MTNYPKPTPLTNTRRARGDRGANLVEYAVLVVLIAAVCMATVALLTRNSVGKTSPVTTSSSTVP